MSNLPGFIPGEKAHEYAAVMASKRGTVGYIPVSPSAVKKAEVKKEEVAKSKKEK